MATQDRSGGGYSCCFAPRPRLRHDAKQLVIGEEVKSPERIRHSRNSEIQAAKAAAGKRPASSPSMPAADRRFLPPLRRTLTRPPDSSGSDPAGRWHFSILWRGLETGALSALQSSLL